MLEINIRYKPLLKFTAICSFLGALTTALLIFLPGPEADDFESRALLFEDPLYIGKLWILFIHPQVNIIACIGIFLILHQKYPLRMYIGFFFLTVWAFTEMSQQSLLIDSLNMIWRPGYIDASNEADKSMYRTLIHTATGLSASKYFLVIYGFGIGSLLYGFALAIEKSLGKWIGYALIFIGLLSLASFFRYYLGASFLNSLVNTIYEWIYSFLQPLVRIAIGIWIWKQIEFLNKQRNHITGED